MPLPARSTARIVWPRKNQSAGRPAWGGANDRCVPPVCVGKPRCNGCVDGRRRRDRDGTGMQESRAARHALLRREQRPGRRRADRSEKAARSFHARIRLHPGGGPGGLSERVQAAHRFPGSVHRQAGSLLPGAIELGRDRGDALGSPARRGLLDRTDGIRRQYGGRGSVRRQGHRKGTAGLPSPVASSRRTAPTRSSPI